MKNILNKLLLTATILIGTVNIGFSQDEAEAITYTDPKIALSFDVVDSIQQIKVSLTGKDPSGKVVPVPEITVAVFINKSFGMLPVEGESMATDENGEVYVPFPENMPGDNKGNVTVIAKIEDDEKVGTIETSAVSSWGKITHPENKLNKRALWAARANAPIPLIIAVNFMIALVWGVIFYILYQLLIINKIGKYENQVKS